MSSYVRPTHQDGIAVAEAIAAEHGVEMYILRQVASQHLSEDWPEDEGMGSSDVSCHLSSLGNYEPDVLHEGVRDHLERQALLQKVMAYTGKSERETLDSLAAMFAPA